MKIIEIKHYVVLTQQKRDLEGDQHGVKGGVSRLEIPKTFKCQEREIEDMGDIGG